jgi:hypothetical protein
MYDFCVVCLYSIQRNGVFFAVVVEMLLNRTNSESESGVNELLS